MVRVSCVSMLRIKSKEGMKTEERKARKKWKGREGGREERKIEMQKRGLTKETMAENKEGKNIS